MPTFLTTKELRTKFPDVRKGMERGVHYIVLHRSRPIGELTPLRPWEHSDGVVELFAHPGKRFTFRARKSAVELVREQRSRR